MHDNQKLWVCWCKKDDYDKVYEIVRPVPNRRYATDKIEREAENYQADYNIKLQKRTELRYDHPTEDKMLVFMAGKVEVNC
jgi:hypothetical protein